MWILLTLFWGWDGFVRWWMNKTRWSWTQGCLFLSFIQSIIASFCKCFVEYLLCVRHRSAQYLRYTWSWPYVSLVPILCLSISFDFDVSKDRQSMHSRSVTVFWEGGSGWGTHVNPWLIHFNVWQNPLQYCNVISLQLIKKKKRRSVTVFRM